MDDWTPDPDTADRTTLDAEVQSVDPDETPAPSLPTAYTPPSGSAGAQLGRRWGLAGQVAWIAIAAVVLACTAAGVPARMAEMLEPCLDPAECFVAQLTPAEQAALEDHGISLHGYTVYLESVAGAALVASVLAAGLIYWRRRDHWIALVASLFLVLSASWATFNPDALGRSIPALAPLTRSHFAATMCLVALMLLLFPNGRFVPRWTRWAALAWVALQALTVIAPHAADAMTPGASWLAALPAVLVFAGGVGVQAYRYRVVSTPVERQQTKWVTIAITVHIVVFALVTITTLVVPRATGAQLFDDPLTSIAWEVVLYHGYVLTFLLIPVALLASVLRYRLWDIDFLINRSLIYGALTALLFLLFLGSVVGLQRVFASVTDGRSLAVVIGFSALLVGLLFQPARRFLQRLVDQRLYGIGVDYAGAIREQRRGLQRPLQPRPQAEGLRDYRDLELIGRGGMAEIYRATHGRLNRSFAIKILMPQTLLRDPTHVERFEREARIISALSHPNIVSLHDFGTGEDGSRFIVMQYVAGGDLNALIKREGRLSVEQALPLLKDLARGLDYAHGHGIIHRDIKPSNVLLDPIEATGPVRTHRAVLTDFGIAKLLSGTNLTATNILGTLDYMSPEQINDSAEVDERADVYSLGVLAYKMLTGERPFAATSPTAMLIAHLQQPAPDVRDLAPDVPERVALALRKAMAKDPLRRYPTVGAMVADMHGMTEGQRAGYDRPSRDD